jgi:hypothetical protein
MVEECVPLPTMEMAGRARLVLVPDERVVRDGSAARTEPPRARAEAVDSLMMAVEVVERVLGEDEK